LAWDSESLAAPKALLADPQTCCRSSIPVMDDLKQLSFVTDDYESAARERANSPSPAARRPDEDGD